MPNKMERTESMSFFKLLKKVADVAEALEDIVEEQAAREQTRPQAATISQTENQDVTETTAQATQTQASRTSWGYEFPAGYIYEPEQVRSRDQLLDDMKKLLKAHFSDYHIYFQVPTDQLDSSAHSACVPVTFLFEKNDRYPLAVMVVRKNTYKGMNVVATQNICRKMGMQCLRFYEEYANDDDYVVGRIRNALS